MPHYVDGFVIPILTRNLPAYRKLAQLAGKVWKEHGALEYYECFGDDLKIPFGLPFPKLCKLKPGQTVLFSWIVYKSRAHRDRVNKAVMADPRLSSPSNGKMPFDMKTLSFGGFRVLVKK